MKSIAVSKSFSTAVLSCVCSGTACSSAAMRAFACRYGLLGIMTAMPTTAKFIEYEKVYFHKNQLFSVESMDTEEYLGLFFPFIKPDFHKKGVESVWNTNDRMEMAVIMTYHQELREHPTLVWDFHSLLLNVQLLISMNMTDEKNPLKICHKCQRPFFASKADAKYCSPECRDKARKEKGKK